MICRPTTFDETIIHFQETIPVGNKIEDLLSRISALEKRVDSDPSDAAEERSWDKMILYVIVPLVVLGAEFLPASFRISEVNSGCCTAGQGNNDFPPTTKMIQICSNFCSNFSKTYERLSLITRFDRDSDTITRVDKDNRWNNKLRCTIGSVN